MTKRAPRGRYEATRLSVAALAIAALAAAWVAIAATADPADPAIAAPPFGRQALLSAAGTPAAALDAAPPGAGRPERRKTTRTSRGS